MAFFPVTVPHYPPPGGLGGVVEYATADRGQLSASTGRTSDVVCVLTPSSSWRRSGRGARPEPSRQPQGRHRRDADA